MAGNIVSRVMIRQYGSKPAMFFGHFFIEAFTGSLFQGVYAILFILSLPESKSTSIFAPFIKVLLNAKQKNYSGKSDADFIRSTFHG